MRFHGFGFPTTQVVESESAATAAVSKRVVPSASRDVWLVMALSLAAVLIDRLVG